MGRLAVSRAFGPSGGVRARLALRVRCPAASGLRRFGTAGWVRSRRRESRLGLPPREACLCGGTRQASGGDPGLPGSRCTGSTALGAGRAACRRARPPRVAHSRRVLVLAEPSCPTRRLNSSLCMGSAPPASWRSRSNARRQVSQRSQRPPSTKPRERRPRRRRGASAGCRSPQPSSSRDLPAALHRASTRGSRVQPGRSRNGS
jgi:hypothetical protein